MNGRKYILVAVEGPDAGKRWELDPAQSVTVGRGDWLDIQIEHDDSVSREHFRLGFLDRCWLVTNLSRNGTSVNGEFVSEVPIQIGDRLEIGNDTVLSLTEAATVDDSQAAAASQTSAHVLDEEGETDDEEAGTAETGVSGAAFSKTAEIAPEGVPAVTMHKLCALWVVQGAAAGHSVPLTRDLPTTVGRDALCTLTITDDEAVSRRHCEIVGSEEGYELRNASQNGTLVNGNLVDAAPLHDGDEIRIGNHTILRVSLAEPITPSASTAESKRTTLRVEHENGVIQWTVPLNGTTAAAVVRSIEAQSPGYLMLDFTRAGLDRGARFPQAGVLLPELMDEHLPELTPVIIPMTEAAEEVEELTGQSWGRDALLMIFTQRPFEELVAALQGLAHYDPIHDCTGSENSVFGFWYPAILYQLLSVGQPHVTARVLSDVQAIAIEGMSPDEICVFTTRDFDNTLASAFTAASETA